MARVTKKQIYMNNPALPTAGADFEWTPEMVSELKKCRENVLHFAENYFFIINLDEGKQKIKLHPYQRKALRMIRDNRFSLLLFSRQTGKSTISTIYMLWTAIFFNDQKIMLVANKENTAKEIFKRIRLAYEQLPNWLKSPVNYYGLESLELENGSRISISTTTGTAGRGSAANLLFVDEADWIDSHLLNEFWASVYPIISSSMKSKIIMASTPRDTAGLFYRLYNGSVKGENEWQSLKILWNEVPGRTEKWKQQTIASLSDISMWRREFECVDGKTLVTILKDNKEQSIIIENLYDIIDFNKNNIKILTPNGFETFSGIQKLEKDCLELILSTTSLKCSKNHRILTKSEGFKIAEDLKINDEIQIKNGFDNILKIKRIGMLPVYDLLNVESNQYYTNDIVSHNCEFDEVGESALDKELFDQMKKYTLEPMYLMDEGKYSLWEKPSDEKIYVAGVDVAEGVGKDATVVQILDITDPKRIKQVAVYHNNKITPTEFTPKLREILQHWGDPLAMIERNNCGAQVVDNLKKDFNYENIVNWGVDRVANRTSNKLGIIAHTNTKYHGVMNQRYWINIEKRVQINDVGTVLELNDFVRSKAGTWSAKNGSHDDRVMSLIWALMVLHEDIAPVYFDIIEKDGNGKPVIIKSIDYGIKYFMNPLSIYGNEKDGLGGDALPSFMGGGSQVENPDIDDLFNQGWRPY